MSERTKIEAVLDVRYGVRYNELNERLYNRLDLGLGLLTLLGGSGAAVAAAQQSPQYALWSGLLLAAAAIWAQLLGAARKAEQHAQAKRAYGAIDARSSGMTLEQIDRELRILQGAAPSGVELLAMPAHIANMRSEGYPTDHRLGWGERAAALLA